MTNETKTREAQAAKAQTPEADHKPPTQPQTTWQYLDLQKYLNDHCDKSVLSDRLYSLVMDAAYAAEYYHGAEPAAARGMMVEIVRSHALVRCGLTNAQVDAWLRGCAARLLADQTGFIHSSAGFANLVQPVSEVPARQAEYLLPPYLPKGMLSIMGGVSGVGKTWLVLSWAAAVSQGRRPGFCPTVDLQNPDFKPGNVYYFTQENDPNCVVRPRLEALGADLNKVFIHSLDEEARGLTLNDERLEITARMYPPALVIFDPIQSYLGAGVEMNKANEIRPILDWLGNFAKKHDCAVVLISHMAKPGAGHSAALDRLLGSSDFRNAARSIILVGRDPEDATGATRVFAHAKNSLGTPGRSQRYHITGQGVVYDGPCDYTGDEIVRGPQQPRQGRPALYQDAAQQLEALLGEKGYARLEEVEQWRQQAGMGMPLLYKLRKKIGARTYSMGQPPHRMTWWVMPWADLEQLRAVYQPEQLALLK